MVSRECVVALPTSSGISAPLSYGIRLWNTMTRDFPKLDDLLGSLMISNVVADVEEQPGVSVEAERFRKLPPVEAGSAIHSGTSIPPLYFDSIGKAQALRIGRSADNIPMFAHSKTETFQRCAWPTLPRHDPQSGLSQPEGSGTGRAQSHIGGAFTLKCGGPWRAC